MEKVVSRLRYERKFVIPDLRPLEIEQLIKQHPLCFKEVFYPRWINNIYLESLEKKSFHQNVRGDQKREKTRIRWYGDFFQKFKGNIEIKTKNGMVGDKIVLPLNEIDFEHGYCVNALMNSIRESGLDYKNSLYFLNESPIIANRYRRKYFLSHNKKVRLTLDSNLLSGPITKFSNKNIFKSKYIENIVELKYKKEDSHHLHNFTVFFPFLVTKNSKYVNAVEKAFQL